MNVYPFGQTFVDPFGRTWGQWGEILIVAPAAGVRDGGAMVLDAATLGLTPLNGYVDGLVEQNQGAYAANRWIARGGVTTLQVVGGGQIVQLGRAAMAARAARLAQIARIQSNLAAWRETLRLAQLGTGADRALRIAQAQREIAIAERALRALGLAP